MVAPLAGFVAGLLVAAGVGAVLYRRQTAALRESERKFATAFRSSPDAIVITRVEDGVFVEVNDGYAALSGYSRAETLGRSTVKLAWVEPADRSGMIATLRAEGRLRDFRTRMKTRTGDVRDVLINSTPITVGGSPCLLGVIRDVTDEVRRQAALAESEQKLAKLFAASPNGVVISRVADGVMLELNPAFAKLIGYPRDELIGRSALALGLWADPAEREAVAAELRSNGRVVGHDVHFRTAAGEVRELLLSIEPLDIDGVACAVGSAQDVTDRRRAQRALAASERKFAALFASSPVAMTVGSAVDGRFLDVNRAFDKLYGYPRDHVIGRTPVELGLYPDPSLRDRMLKVLMADGHIHDFEMPVRRADGTVAETLGSVELVELDGETFLVSCAIEITERRRAERALAASERKFATVFQTSPHPIGLSDVETGRMTDVNDMFVASLGWPREELVGRSTVDLGVWVDPTQRAAIWDELTARGRVRNWDVTFRRRDGEFRDVLFSVDLVEMDGRRYAVSAWQDFTDLRRMGAAVVVSERKLAALFRLSPVALTLSRVADGKVLDVNQGFEELFGVRREQVIGRSVTEFGIYPDPAVRDRLGRDLRRVGRLRGEELEMRRADGTPLTVVGAAEALELDGEAVVISSAVDVSAQKRAERQFAAVFRLSPVAIAVARADDGKLIDVNQGFEELYRVSRERALATPATELGIYPDPAVRQRMFELLKRNGRLRDIELELRRADGTPVTVLGSAELIQIDGVDHLISCATDITERRRAERVRAESERKFAAVFRLSPVSLALSRLDGGIVDVNQAFETLYGLSRDEVVGRSSADFAVLYSGPAERAEWVERLKASGRLRDIEIRRERADGTVIHTVTSAERIDLDGEPCALVAAADVAPLKQAQAALRQANAGLELRVAARTAELAAVNAELEAFCYSVSHDLRAPLRAVAGFSQAVQEDYADKLDADGRDLLARIRGAARRMGELIDDLLALSRVSRGEMARRPVDLSALAGRVAADLSAVHPDRVVEVVIPPGLTADADPNLLRVAVENLIGNAWKYTSRNPTARIELRAEARHGVPVYAVADDGVGFDPTYSAKLFQPFQRLHRADEFDGHGIGLATVRRVVARHGGTVWADGAVGRGATFYFTLEPFPAGAAP